MTRHHQRGLTTPVAAGIVIALGLTAMGAWALRSDRATEATGDGLELAEVVRGGFEIRLPATGELAAARQTEIKNKLEARAVITELAEEGSIVREGDVLVKFNDEDIRIRLQDAEESVVATQNELDSAEADLEIKIKTRDSEIEKAELKIEIAELDLHGWLEGEVVKKRKELELAVETAELNFARLDQLFEASKRLFEQKFISEDEYKRDEIDLVGARAKLEQVRLDVEVYEKYTFVKDGKQKRSDLSQALKELTRIEARQNAQVHRAESTVFSKKSRLTSKQERLKKRQEQLENCTILAPQDGLVVYASSLEAFSWMRRNGESIQVGRELWHNQMVMILPDTSRMVAEVKINESLSGLIVPGQRAIVTCDAAPDDVLMGEVESIGVLAESGDWRDPNRRDYTVRIKLDGENVSGLKPSMRCQADVRVEEVTDAIHVPIQAIHREGAQVLVYVPQGGGFAQRAVEVGRSSELYIEILEGLTAGEQVLLRAPHTEEIVSKLPPMPEPEAAMIDDAFEASAEASPEEKPMVAEADGVQRESDPKPVDTQLPAREGTPTPTLPAATGTGTGTNTDTQSN